LLDNDVTRQMKPWRQRRCGSIIIRVELAPANWLHQLGDACGNPRRLIAREQFLRRPTQSSFRGLAEHAPQILVFPRPAF
jgi:hypothetical protein